MAGGEPLRPVALVLRALGLGDFLTGLPALQLIGRALPEHEIVLAAPEVFAPFVGLLPAVDRLFPRGELQSLTNFGSQVDIGIDLHGKGPESRRLLAELQPRRVVGFADPAAGLTGPPWWPDEHEVERWCRMVTRAFEIRSVSAESAHPSVAGAMRVPELGALPRGVTIVHPGAAAPARRWPADRFAAVIDRLGRAGHQVVVTGGPAEAELVQNLCAKTEAVPMLGLSLPELAALIANARLLVCGDTGVAHLASAYRTRSVLLFGPVSPRLWGPPADPRHLVLFRGDGTGDPHGVTPDPALLRITPAEVLRAVAALTPA